MIERTEVTVELDSKDIAQAINEYVVNQGIACPGYARIDIHTEDATFPISKATLSHLHAKVTIKNGSKKVEVGG